MGLVLLVSCQVSHPVDQFVDVRRAALSSSSRTVRFDSGWIVLHELLLQDIDTAATRYILMLSTKYNHSYSIYHGDNQSFDYIASLTTLSISSFFSPAPRSVGLGISFTLVQSRLHLTSRLSFASWRCIRNNILYSPLGLTQIPDDVYREAQMRKMDITHKRKSYTPICLVYIDTFPISHFWRQLGLYFIAVHGCASWK